MDPKYEATDPAIFQYTAPNDEHKEKFERLTKLWAYIVDELDEICPVSREKSLAITKLDELRFFANASIVRRS